ncbi:uncharacterized protein LOC116936604 [Daphnia magna]|uniref:uncharacterized protein LOC116936604 n=1 Tax=Daphnia magna TaxID=35525 RepID=UPI001E1BB455|nr:uncharacterized protein LOC116936604 [Daphnia magna]
MESEPEETCLDLPNLPMQQNIQNLIANLQLSVPLFPTRVPFVDIHNPLTKSPVERRKEPANQCVYTPDELDQLDLAGLLEPKSKEQLDEIMHLFHAAVHERDVVCCVCDQFLRISESKLVQSASLPTAFFEKLQQPTGKNADADVLHSQLVQQHDVSKFFPSERKRFAKLVLSPRGIEKDRLSCTPDGISDCDCKPFLRICKKKCYDCLKRNALPKLAIANGNWFGQLPEQLRNMRLGPRRVVRQVHNSGHFVSYSSQTYVRVTSITGHIYSNGLDTTLVRMSLPLQPSEVPLRVIVVPRFSKNETIIEKAKIAAMKKNYIIDPKAIEQTLNFWKEVGNKVMAKAEFNKTNCERLPINDVSPAMFTMMDTDNEEAETELDGSSHEIAEKREHSSGGSSLLRTGETGKTRRIKISRKALLAYMLNLSPRQFQEVDFVLPMYDMVTRQQEQWGTDGTLSTKAEAFGQISVEDMKKFGEHKINCAKTASKGGILPPPPVSLGGVAAEFFNDIMVATKHNQHSMAAAAENRGGVYAAHNSLGKAHIWFTFCPDDTKSFKILWYSLVLEQSAIYKDQIPDEIIRF